MLVIMPTKEVTMLVIMPTKETGQAKRTPGARAAFRGNVSLASTAVDENATRSNPVHVPQGRCQDHIAVS